MSGTLVKIGDCQLRDMTEQARDVYEPWSVYEEDIYEEVVYSGRETFKVASFV